MRLSLVHHCTLFLSAILVCSYTWSYVFLQSSTLYILFIIVSPSLLVLEFLYFLHTVENLYKSLCEDIVNEDNTPVPDFDIEMLRKIYGQSDISFLS